MNQALSDLVVEATRLIFLGLFPTVAIICLGSLLSSILQTSISVYDVSISITVRLLALLLALYLFLPSIISSLIELCRMAYGS